MKERILSFIKDRNALGRSTAMHAIMDYFGAFLTVKQAVLQLEKDNLISRNNGNYIAN